MVEAEASVTPRSITSRCSSVREKRDSGAPRVAGSSRATAFTAAISSGGKTARLARPRPVLESPKPLTCEASSPAAHHLFVHVEPPPDLPVGQPVGRVEDEPGALDQLVGERVAGAAVLKLPPLLSAECDLVGLAPRHRTLKVAARDLAPSEDRQTELPA